MVTPLLLLPPAQQLPTLLHRRRRSSSSSRTVTMLLPGTMRATRPLVTLQRPKEEVRSPRAAMRLAEVDEEVVVEVDEDADRVDGRTANGLGALDGQVVRTRVRRARVAAGRRLLVPKAARRPEAGATAQHKLREGRKVTRKRTLRAE